LFDAKNHNLLEATSRHAACGSFPAKSTPIFSISHQLLPPLRFDVLKAGNQPTQGVTQFAGGVPYSLRYASYQVTLDSTLWPGVQKIFVVRNPNFLKNNCP
jgi:hypothetical protein